MHNPHTLNLPKTNVKKDRGRGEYQFGTGIWLNLLEFIINLNLDNATIKLFCKDIFVSDTVKLRAHYSSPSIYICSSHPLAIHTITKIVSPYVSIAYTGDISCLDIASVKRDSHILLIDTCSLNHWVPAASQWRDKHGSLIALVPRSPDYVAELHAIQMGIPAVVVISPSLERDLPEAIQAAANGRIWMRPETMAEYSRRSFEASKPVCISLLTQREQQIAKLIQEQFSNRDIAAALNISERTVKFHVSNILQKYHVKHRSSLLLMRARELPRHSVETRIT